MGYQKILPLLILLVLISLWTTPIITSAQVTIPGKYAYIGTQPILVDYQPVGTEYLMAYRTSNGVVFTYTNGTYRSFSLNTNSATPIVVTYNGVPYIITNDQNPSGGTSIYVSTMKPNDMVYNYTLPTSSFISPVAVQLSGSLLQLVFGGYSLFINLTDMKGYIYNMTTTYIDSKYFVIDGPEIYLFDDNWNYVRTLQLQYTGSSTDYSILIPYVVGTSNDVYLAFDFKGSSEIVKLAKIVGTSLYAFNADTGTMIPHVKSDDERLGVIYSKTFYGEIQPNTTESAQYVASQSSIPSNFIFILYGYSDIFSVLEHNNQYYIAMGSNLYVIPKPSSMNAGPLITPPFTLFLYPNTQWKDTTLLQDFSLATSTESYRQPSVQTLLPTQATLTENNGVLTFNTISILDLMNDISTRFTVEMDEANNVLIYPNNNFVFGVYNYSDYKLVSTTESKETPCKANMSTGSRVFDGPNYNNYGLGVTFYKYSGNYYFVYMDVITVFNTSYGKIVGFNIGGVQSVNSNDRSVNITMTGQKIDNMISLVSVKLPEGKEVKQVLVDGVPTDKYTIKDGYITVDPTYTISILLSSESGGIANLGGTATPSTTLIVKTLSVISTLLAISLTVIRKHSNI